MIKPTAIKVLVVDDSPLIRTILTHVLNDEPDITVVGGAKDAYEARDLILEFKPDVIILDIEMPRMSGLELLRRIMNSYAVPVIMCSGVAPANSQMVLDCIEFGAVDVVAKPDASGPNTLKKLGMELADKVRAATQADVSKKRPAACAIRPSANATAPSAVRTCRSANINPARHLIALGASTGGTEAIREFLMAVPPDTPPIAIVQHMPPGFTKSFAERLNQICNIAVQEAVDGQTIAPGQAVIAKGGIQMTLRRTGDTWRVAFGDSEPVNRHCPSVDVMFDSVALKPKGVVGVLLTGMGADGARGMKRLYDAGVPTFAQDQQSCVVYGMPRAAVELGAVHHSAPPCDIPGMILNALSRKTARV